MFESQCGVCWTGDGGKTNNLIFIANFPLTDLMNQCMEIILRILGQETCDWVPAYKEQLVNDLIGCNMSESEVKEVG